MGPLNSSGHIRSNLLQSLSGELPELSTDSLQSALEKASPGDLIQLSDQALELQQVGLLFGNQADTQSTAFNPAPDSLFSILGPASSNASPDPVLQALESSLASPNGATSSPKAGELDTLFGAPQDVDPFLNMLG